MSMIPLLYVIPAALTGVLRMLARNVAPPEGGGEETRGIRGQFLRIGLWIYEKMPFRKKGGGIDRIASDLSVLEPRVRPEEARRLYYADKIGTTLIVLCAGSLLAALVSFSARQERVVGEDGRIGRKSYGGGAREETLIYTAADDASFAREITVSVAAREYTKEEADALFAEAASLLPETILNGDASLDEVRNDLRLSDRMEGYPFSIAWKIGDYSLLHSDGKLQRENIPAEGAVTALTAQFSYLEYNWEEELAICVYPPLYTQEELWEQGMQEILRQADRATVHEESMKLPERIGGSVYLWEGKVRDDAAPLFLLFLLTAAAVFLMKDRDLGKRAREREEELTDDYPQFVSKLALYLGAGMTVRNVFVRLAKAYADQCEKGAPRRYLGEELKRAVNGLESGMSEAAVYEQFGLRCRAQPYIRLCALLTQNLRKGGGELLKLLHEESEKALTERMDRARRRGEEAGTKLLLPMMLMLVIVMVIIMIPAYLSF